MQLTSKQLELLPGDADVDFYRQNGYYITKKLFSEQEIEDAVYGAERYYAGERDFAVPSTVKPFEGWKPGDGDGLRINDYVSMQNRDLWSLVFNPLLGAIAARLSGSRAVRLWHDQMIFKPLDQSGTKTCIGWHTDRAYWRTCTSDNMLTAWMPFQNCDEAMGPLMVVAGSHLWGGNENLRSFHTNDESGLREIFETQGRAVDIVRFTLEVGQVSFHHCLTIHGSGPNRSETPRHSISIHLQDAPNRYCEYRQSDGKLAWHRNDVLCRALSGQPDYADPDFCPVLWEEPQYARAATGPSAVAPGRSH